MTTPDDGADAPPEETVATGILQAERRAQGELARRRRLLVGGAVLGLVVVGAVLATTTVLQQQANSAAQVEADRLEARAALATEVVARAEDYEPPASVARDDAAAMRATMEQLLSATEASDDELTTRAEELGARLEAAAAEVAELAGREVTEPSELVVPERAVVVLRELETLRAEAGALAEEVPVAVADGLDWVALVRTVNDAVTQHVEQVEAEEPTSDPDELAALWDAERPALRELGQAARTAGREPGLADWARAHEEYAADMLDWIEEAIGLLEAGELETYNERFEELFDDDDPFGFDARTAAATSSALRSPALLQLGTVVERAELVLDAVRTTEEATAEQLGE